MFAAPIPEDEMQRQHVLEGYGIVETLPEQAYDDITHLASEICRTPIASITFLDRDRQWFKSRVGIDVTETPREISFCGHAILEPGSLMVVEDAQKDARFADNPLVTGDPHIRFYAGAPLVTPDGHALGTLCVIDREARDLNESQARSLRALARQIMAQLELRRKLTETEELSHLRDSALDRLQAAQARFDAFMENSPTAAFIKNDAGRVIFGNRAFFQMLGREESDVLDRPPEEVWKADGDVIAEHDRQVLSEKRTLRFEESYTTPDGRTGTWLSFRFPLPGFQGEALLGGVSLDITERIFYEQRMEIYQQRLEEAVARLEELAVTDALTGVRNKRSFEQSLTEEVERSRRYRLPLSLIVLDIDHFKQYNDTEGHAAGDDVLKAVGGLLRSTCRPNDFVARYGGEEFVILLRSTPVEGAFLLAERIRRRFRETNWPQRPVTASFGVAGLQDDVPDGRAFFSVADKALYEAKAAGRDRVKVAD